ILESDLEVATGAGHHSVIKGRGKDEYYIIYHRHPLGATSGNNREVCIERMYFREDGTIAPVKITFDGVPATKL
ncbi:MAG: family 43 glycosylhydrolase, partial [Bacteroidales bacterium]|nr:family 43 glycosylhydrolase [Bacteroidales bacterium]